MERNIHDLLNESLNDVIIESVTFCYNQGFDDVRRTISKYFISDVTINGKVVYKTGAIINANSLTRKVIKDYYNITDQELDNNEFYREYLLRHKGIRFQATPSIEDKTKYIIRDEFGKAINSYPADFVEFHNIITKHLECFKVGKND